jgi:hypothetical protein
VRARDGAAREVLHRAALPLLPAGDARRFARARRSRARRRAPRAHRPAPADARAADGLVLRSSQRRVCSRAEPLFAVALGSAQRGHSQGARRSGGARAGWRRS